MADRPDILVVDDESELRGMLAEYLGRRVLSVRTASGGAELTACLARAAPDLLILGEPPPALRASKCRTAALASPSRSDRGCSTRSSPPSRSALAPASG